jgi:hypothetical protein
MPVIPPREAWSAWLSPRSQIIFGTQALLITVT